MNKMQHIKIKMIILVVTVIYLFLKIHGGYECPVLHYTGIPCMACGMTRAWIAALHLDFQTAFHMHPMFWSVPFLVLYILYEGNVFKKKEMNFLMVGFILAGFLVTYIFRLI